MKHIPTETQMGKVYKRLILDTMQPGENYVDGDIFVRKENSEIQLTNSFLT